MTNLDDETLLSVNENVLWGVRAVHGEKSSVPVEESHQQLDDCTHRYFHVSQKTVVQQHGAQLNHSNYMESC